MENKMEKNGNTQNLYKLKQQEAAGETEENEREEDFREDFQCCICWELLYKPVVLACGHLSCFWCIYNAMSHWHESNCPICRHPYNHFPSVCQLLHFLLLKMYPVAYRRRERQVQEDEKEMGHSSPQFDFDQLATVSHFNQKLDISSKSMDPPADLAAPQTKSSSLENLPKATPGDSNETNTAHSQLCRSSEGSESTATDKSNLIEQEFVDTAQEQCSVSISDLLCSECKKLLFRPVVLNCGHVYCETCIPMPVGETPKCQICQSLHPNGIPGVCLVLENFLQELFPKLYAKRRESLHKQMGTSNERRQEVSAQNPHSLYSSWLTGRGPKVHIGVGCDSCGMSPIVGERYKCKDCTEKIGFDLCEACHNNPSKLLGRFNQQHKPHHKFKIEEPMRLPWRFSFRTEDGLDDSEGEEAPAVTSSDNVSSDNVPHGAEHAFNVALNIIRETGIDLEAIAYHTSSDREDDSTPMDHQT